MLTVFEEEDVSRRQRQREQIVAALRQRDFGRVLVLSREHLAEFPDDVEVGAAAEEAARHRPDGPTTRPER
jgi:hypothetical protein